MSTKSAQDFLQKMFDLNKTPALEEELVQGFKAGSSRFEQFPALYERTATGMKFIGPWQFANFGQSDLASLYNMVQELPNYHPPIPAGHQILAHRPATRTSGPAWITWLPPHRATTFSGAPAGDAVNTTLFRCNAPPYFETLTTPAAAPPTTAPVISSFFQHGRAVAEAWSSAAGGGQSGGQNQPIQCQTTTEMDRHDVSDGESDSCMSRNYEHSKGRSAVRLVELDSTPNECTKLPIVPKSDASMAESSQQGGISPMAGCKGLASTYLWWAKKLVYHQSEERRKKDVAFNAAFNFNTVRCTPTTPCRSCLDFCKTPLPRSQAAPVGQLVALYANKKCPPVLKNMDEQEAAQKKWARHGPKSKSSDYRGVTFYKRTGRWEAHIWHGAAQVYLGASASKEEAASAYDKAAIMLCGPDVDINFKPESYQVELAHLYKLSKEQLVIYLRRDSRGYGAQATYPGVKHFKNNYQAVYGSKLLGIFTTEDEAASAVYEEAVADSFGAMASLIIDTHHVRNMPSYAAERFAALFPEEAAEAMKLRNLKGSSASKRISVLKRQNSTLSPPTRKRSTRAAPKPTGSSSSSPAGRATAPSPPDAVEEPVLAEEPVPAAALPAAALVQPPSSTRATSKPSSSSNSPAARATAPSPDAVEEQLPAPAQITEDVPPPRVCRTWGSHLALKRARHSVHPACIQRLREKGQTFTSALPTVNNNSLPVHQSDVNIAVPQPQIWPTHLYPRPAGTGAIPETPAAPAWSSTCPLSATVLSTFNRTDSAITSSAHPKLILSSTTPGTGESSHSKTDVATTSSAHPKMILPSTTPGPGTGESSHSKTDVATTSSAHPKLILPATTTGPGTGESSHSKTDVPTTPGSVKFKLFNVEIDVTEPGHHGGNVKIPRTIETQVIPKGQSGGDLDSEVDESRMIDKLALLSRKRCKITGEGYAFDPYEQLASPMQLSPGLDELVSINEKLHDIVAGAIAPPRFYEAAPLAVLNWHQPPVLQTGLTLEQTRCFPNRYMKHRKPRCTCVFRR